MTLTELFAADTSPARSDKASHGYPAIYDALFEPLRNMESPLLEIGVGNGGSMRVWREFFPYASLHGIDIAPPSQTERLFLTADGERELLSVCHHHGNSESGPFLAGVGEDCGPFGIVIDDGGHRGDQQETAFRELWPYVLSGGYYVIEDLHASYLEEYAPSIMPGLKWLVDRAVLGMDKIESIAFYKKLFVARKK